MARRKIAIIGAGLAGSTIACELSWRSDYHIDIFEKRSHIGGNIHTERDPETCVMLHKYGPHIFHTDDEKTWNWFSQFGTMMPHTQRTKGVSRGKVYSLPINLHTLNQFYGRTWSPEEARVWINDVYANWALLDPQNFEEAAKAAVGPDLYEAFFWGYTQKQWGIAPRELPASVFKRLPLRFDYNDNAFTHRFQGIPREGYTKMIENMLDIPDIHVHLNHEHSHEVVDDYDHVFWTGPIDEFYRWRHGVLPYRTLDFEVLRGLGDMQGCSVMNWCDREVPYTRSTEHKHFTPWEQHGPSIVTREFPRQMEKGDVPFYPIRLAKEQATLREYEELASKATKVTFAGRLGTYQYLDMDKTIIQARATAIKFHLENCRR